MTFFEKKKLVHTPVPIRKATKVPSVKIAREGRSEDSLLQKDGPTVPSLECLYFHRHRQLFLSTCVDDLKWLGEKPSYKSPCQSSIKWFWDCTQRESTTKASNMQKVSRKQKESSEQVSGRNIWL